jgi:5-carboxymethyl-2-hydroxymuconate isomerase
MPHVIIEYAESLQSQITAEQLINTVHGAVISSELFTPSHVKTRLVCLEHIRAGLDNLPFIHIQIRLHQGRTSPQKASLTRHIIDTLSQLALISVTLTAEVVELETESYAKHVMVGHN